MLKKYLIAICVLAGCVALVFVYVAKFVDSSSENVAKIEEKYRQDDYGGKVPEETMQYFYEALQKKDIVLASKYFAAEEQKSVIRELEAAKDSQTLDALLHDLEKKKEGLLLSPDSYRYTIYDENNVAELTFDLILNPYTKKWKIKSL